ncbi:hypothetical protein OBBRIDRAFT_516986 [Obba rivulosa]|uniref:DUF6533 domain-containing protein n=1 Tax=Obba rivulosa TaxID=1052685 RepID=A0A8E2B0J5_9APHY|nr:hypothetical protein OBBRIDRAFT_516986 [Obba rivulosa]
MGVAVAQDLVKLLQNLEYGKYGCTAALAIAIYDYCITFSDEVTLIWPTQWSFTKLLFLLNRYSPFLDIMLSVQLSFNVIDPEACTSLFRVFVYTFFGGIVTAECILLVRTYAIWNCNKTVLCILVMSIGTCVPIFALLNYFIDSLTCESQTTRSTAHSRHGIVTDPALLSYVACDSPPSRVSEEVWELCLVPETTAIVLTLVHRYRLSKQLPQHPPLFKVLYRDGILFYLAMLGMIIFNVLSMIAGYPEIALLLDDLIRVSHSALCTRVLLHLRKAAFIDEDSTFSSTIQFDTESDPAYEGMFLGDDSTA